VLRLASARVMCDAYYAGRGYAAQTSMQADRVNL